MGFADGDVHAYFNPYESPYEAFISYMNAIHDLRHRLEKVTRKKDVQEVTEKLSGP